MVHWLSRLEAKPGMSNGCRLCRQKETTRGGRLYRCRRLLEAMTGGMIDWLEAIAAATGAGWKLSEAMTEGNGLEALAGGNGGGN